MESSAAQQDGPRPDESQADFERRTGQAPAAGGTAATAPSAAELRAQLEEAEARESTAQGQQQAAAIGAQQGPPASSSAAAAVAAGTAGQAQMPADLAGAAPGSLGTGAPEGKPAMEITHTEPILTQGASGDAVQRLVKLLAHAGYASNSVVNASPTNIGGVLDVSVMNDVQRFWNDHPEARESDELFYGRDAGVTELQGQWVGPHTWQVLYDLAGAGQ